jgi:hypothetical protein
MELQWNTIPISIRRNLEQSLLERGNEFSASSLSGFLKGSSGMSYGWSDNHDVQKMIYYGIKRWFGDKNRVSADTQALSSIICSFGQLKMNQTTKKDIPKEIKESFYNGIEKNFSQFISREISNIFYG